MRLLIPVLALATVGPALAAGDDGKNEIAGGSDYRATQIAIDAAECRRNAEETVRNMPAVRSGRTSYLPEGGRPYYESCMADRGHETYPPY